MSGASATSFFLAALWLVLVLLTTFTTDVWMGHDGEREAQEAQGAIVRLAWTVGLVFALGHAAAGTGLMLERPWGKAAAWIMMPWALLFAPFGTIVGIYQMVVLPRHP